MSDHVIFYTALLLVAAFIALVVWAAYCSWRGRIQRKNAAQGYRQSHALSETTIRVLGNSKAAKQAELKAHVNRNPLDSLPLERKP